MIVAGLLLMCVSEAGALAQIEPFWSWNTPIAWTGFIVFADSIVYRACGRSWIRSTPREFAWLAVASIPLWLVFEFYNLYIDNWSYVGLPEQPVLRYFGYAWSFATIWPAIFEGADLMGVMRAGRAGWAGGSGWTGESGRETLLPRSRPGLPAPPARPALPARPAQPAYPALPAPAIIVGALMLTPPFLVSSSIARYLAAPVWLGFIFLLDPINAWLGGESLYRNFREGRMDQLVNFALSGVLCGVLWEFWNYWARAKWHYTVPILEHVKIFEMPLPGYLGFPPFAIECFTMYVFVRTVVVSAFGQRPAE